MNVIKFPLRHRDEAQQRDSELHALNAEMRTSQPLPTAVVRVLGPKFRVNGAAIEVGKLVDVVDDEALAGLIAAGVVERAV